MDAALSMLGAMLVIGAIDIFVARIAETISVWQFLVLRMVIAGPLILLAARLGAGSVRPARFRALAVRSVFFASGMFCYFGALAFMPIAMALAGLFTSPIFVLLITAFLLRQRIGPWRVLAVAVGFAGILVVLGPSGGDLGWILALPVLGGMLYACGVVTTRTLCAGETTMALVMGIFVAQAVLGLVALAVLPFLPITPAEGAAGFLTRGWTWEMGPAMPYVLLQGVGSVLGVGLLNRAYRLGEASRVAVFEYSIMIFGPVWAWLLLGQNITALQGAGIALIACAGIIIALRSRDAAA